MNRFCLAVIVVSLTGCGLNSARPSMATAEKRLDSRGSARTTEMDAGGGEQPNGLRRSLGSNSDGQQTTAEVPDSRIIYTATMSVTVENFDTIPDAVNRLVKSYGGYIAETRVGNLQGTRRNGNWTIRVPNDRYRDFLQAANGLGVPAAFSSTT